MRVPTGDPLYTLTTLPAGMHREYDEDGEITALGPFRSVAGARRVQILVIPTRELARTDPNDGFDGLGLFGTLVPNPRFPGGPLVVRYAPTLAMARAWLRDLPADLARTVGPTVARFADTMEARLRALDALRERLRADPAERRVAQTILRNAFEWAMYERRWAGPGTPYPVERAFDVGTGANPISPSLVGALVEDQGERYPADLVIDGRLRVMADVRFNACVDAAERNHRTALDMRLSSRVRPIDGSYYPDRLSLVAFLDATRTESDAALLGQNTLDVLHSCRMLLPYLYASAPQWSKFEGEPMPLRASRR